MATSAYGKRNGSVWPEPFLSRTDYLQPRSHQLILELDCILGHSKHTLLPQPEAEDVKAMSHLTDWTGPL